MTAHACYARQMRRLGPVILGLAFVGGCYTGASGGEADPSATAPGSGEGGTDEGQDTDDVPPPGEDAADFGEMTMIRLTRVEYGACIEDVLGFELPQEELNALPDAIPSPFDNDAESQSSSATLVTGYERVGRLVAESITADPQAVDALAPCPEGDESACLADAIASIGRRLLRRPLSAEEVQAFVALADVAEDYPGALRLALTALLQDPEFLFRVEIGESIAGEPRLRRLNDFELASRLSFLLWGVGPDDELLDVAERGQLRTTEQLIGEAERMLESERAVARVQRFFSMLLGYNVLPHEPALADAMRQESNALIARVLEDRTAWREAFVSSQTFVNAQLAEHYGLPAPQNPNGGWVDYGDAPRGGLLSHGSFLALGAKFGDTSPVVRGLEVRRRLLCVDIPPPPPDLEVDVDSPPPGEAECKVDLYAPMVEMPQCAGCHVHLNPVGFGLERFDALGRYRTTEPDKPQCEIAAEGELPGHGPFSGPGELGALLAESEQAELCLGTQLLRYWLARASVEPDSPLAEEFAIELQDVGGDLREVVLRFVARESFLYRQLPEE